MGKWSKYDKVFKSTWLTDPLFKKWLEEKSDKTKAYCKVCKTDIRAHKGDLKKHGESAKHKQNMSAINPKQSSMKAHVVTKKISQLELKLAVYIACHTSVKSIDHLSELLNTAMPSTSTCDPIKLHRTKCTCLIKKVIAPTYLKALVSDMKDSPFSLIIDESTDIACVKHLCVCVRYYSPSHNKIVSQFLGLIPVTSTTAVSLYQHIKDFFSEICVSLTQCFAIGTDGASNLCGRNHSVYQLMKQDIPNLILMKCTCHSLHLACSHASDEMPSNIDYMLRETYNWFHRSALRREDYMKIHRLINDGKDPLQLVPLSGTRWLARSNCVKRILNQWDSLKTHFQFASSDCDKYVARELHSMYSDHSNELYFTFLRPILEDFERVNVLFQKEEADHCRLHEELEKFTLLMLRRILYPTSVKLDVDLNFHSIFLPLDKVDFGYEFSTLLANKKMLKLITDEVVLTVKTRCHKFLVKACKELLLRLPDNMSTIKKMKNLSPDVCLSHTRPAFSELPLELADQTKLSEIESQWRQILTMDWHQTFGDNVPKSGSTFWPKAVKTENAGGDLAFKELSEFALKCHSLPVSNASVERLFSRVTLIKTKLRNRMGLDLLSSILRIKTTLEVNGRCCNTFEPTSDMLRYDSTIYKDIARDREEEEEEEELLDAINL